MNTLQTVSDDGGITFQESWKIPSDVPSFTIEFDITGLSEDEVDIINRNISLARKTEANSLMRLGEIYENTQKIFKHRRNEQGWGHVCKNGFRISIETASKTIKTMNWLKNNPQHQWLADRLGKESIFLVANENPDTETLQNIIEVARLGKVSIEQVKGLLEPSKDDKSWAKGMTDGEIDEVEYHTRKINQITCFAMMDVGRALKQEQRKGEKKWEAICESFSIDTSLANVLINFDGGEKQFKKYSSSFVAWFGADSGGIKTNENLIPFYPHAIALGKELSEAKKIFDRVEVRNNEECQHVIENLCEDLFHLYQEQSAILREMKTNISVDVWTRYCQGGYLDISPEMIEKLANWNGEKEYWEKELKPHVIDMLMKEIEQS